MKIYEYKYTDNTADVTFVVYPLVYVYIIVRRRLGFVHSTVTNKVAPQTQESFVQGLITAHYRRMSKTTLL